MDRIKTGEAIRIWRKNKGLTQAQLAKRCGVSASSITKYESGENRIPTEVAHKIAIALDCTLHDLVVPLSDPEARAKYNQYRPIGAALDTLLDTYGYMIIYEEDTPYLIGKGERLRLSDQLVHEFIESIKTGFIVQIEILKKKAAELADGIQHGE